MIYWYFSINISPVRMEGHSAEYQLFEDRNTVKCCEPSVKRSKRALKGSSSWIAELSEVVSGTRPTCSGEKTPAGPCSRKTYMQRLDAHC